MIQKKILFLISLFLLIFSTDSFAQGTTELYNRGNKAYSSGDYQAAFDLYTQALQGGVNNPDLLYNLGNASYKIGKLGSAMLYYQKGLRLAPSDKEMRENLEFLKVRRVDKVQTPIPGLVGTFLAWLYGMASVNMLLLVTMALFWISILFCSLVLFGKKVLPHFVIMGLITLTFSTFLGTKIYNQGSLASGVVLESVIDARSEPNEASEIVFTIHEGMTFEIKSEQAGWALITLPTGWSGWVKRGAIGIV